MLRRIFIILLSLALTISLCACGETDISDKLFRIDIEAEPKNLDPQMTTDTASLMILENTMDRLFTLDENGSLQNALCESYSVSSDGLRYTFNIKQDVYWATSKNEKSHKLTSYDFVFAFKRLLSPSTKSPFAEDFTLIKNASDIISGKSAIQKLGVYPIDEYTFCIELERESTSFLELLATTPATPCNEGFFNSTAGKYGLEADMLLYSGAFIISSWKHDESVTARKNLNYYDVASTLPARVTFNITTDETTYLDRFIAGSSDVTALPSSHLADINISDYNSFYYEDTTWILAMNNQNSHLADKSLRGALSLALNKSLFSAHLPAWLSIANSFVPPALATQVGKGYDNDATHTYSVEQARILYETHLETSGVTKLPTSTILCLDDEIQPFLAQYIQKSWQDAFGIFLNLEPVDYDTLLSRVNSGNFTFAVFPISASSDNEMDMFSRFVSTSSSNGIGYNSDIYDSIYNSSQNATDDQIPQIIDELEFLLLDDSAFIPLYFQKNYYLTNKDVSGLRFSSFGNIINFKYAGKAD